MNADLNNVSQINQKKIYILCLLFFFFWVAKKYSNFNSCIYIYAHINKFQICYHQFLPDEYMSFFFLVISNFIYFIRQFVFWTCPSYFVMEGKKLNDTHRYIFVITRHFFP